ncbi:MAG: PAS domain-containing sensor histidine kinase, partial [Candidatus Riflebacteria bacterium]|nr:PAS domain-containing sensor histidine kinase [Candidatus Riflebacteria bacterium]
MKKPSEDTQQVNLLRDKIIGLGEKSIRKSYYPELQQRINELEIANARLKEEILAREKLAEQQKNLEEQLHAAQKL